MKSKLLSRGLPIAVFIIIVLLFAVPMKKSNDAENIENDIITERAMKEFLLTSSAFEHEGSIPSVYSCDGDNVNPPLSISGAPESTVTFALIMDDPDIPEVVKKARLIEKFDHWLLFNIPATETEIKMPYSGAGVYGANTKGDQEYTGPCPPTEHEPTEHRYIFQLYALDTELELQAGISEEELRIAMKGHILDKAELIGLFDRANK